MVVVDTIVRLIPGVLKKPEALEHESFQPLTIPAKGGSASGGNHQSLAIESPHYTRPPNFLGWKVPKILLSGNHQKIQAWRLKKSLEKTRRTRPDLLQLCNSAL